MRGTAETLEYGFDVIWHKIIFPNSASAITSAGRNLLPLKLEKGKLITMTDPTEGWSMLHLLPTAANPCLALFRWLRPYLMD